MIERMGAPPKIGWYDTRKKPSGKEEARWAIEDPMRPGHTKVKAKSFNTKEQAKTHARTQANLLLDASLGIGGIRKPIDEAVEDFLDRSLDPKTTALYRRRIGEFLAAFPDTTTAPARPLEPIKWAAQISDVYINRFDKILIATGHNPGGRSHVLRVIRTFCRYAKKKKWMPEYPFDDFKMPTSDFEGRPLTPGEFELMAGPSPDGLNFADPWLNLAFRLGRGTMLRISSVWGLTPKHFRAPDQLWIEEIKGQDAVWITLQPDAVAVINKLLADLDGHERFFWYWGSADAMRNAVIDKGERVGLRVPGGEWPRFHDVCKVTRVSELADAGWSPAAISHVSNTSIKTLVTHYIKADRSRSFAAYQNFQTSPRPAQPGKSGDSPVQDGTPT